ncbi:MAG: L-2-hydroxyglutarate oxidase [Pseudomonadota bacterium]
MSRNFDFIVIGGGIVGASTAWKLQKRYPSKRILLLEKEASCARHQTGRNSGVIHAGVYYQPGSLKASFCRQGLESTIDFCRQHQLPFDQCGKLIVATDDIESERLCALYENCVQNDLAPEQIDRQQLQDIEPHVEGKNAILVRKTGITNYSLVTQTLLDLFEDLGGQVAYSAEVVALHEEENHIDVVTANARLSASFVINCAGLMSDRLITQTGLEPDFMIVPFKGEYYRLHSRLNAVVKHLIYPVPNPELPFLGVHLTRMIDGSVTVGPNAVLAFKREGYSKHSFSLGDMKALLYFKGFRRLIKSQWQHGLREFKNSVFKSQYLKEVQKYCPSVKYDDLGYYPSGIRAQAVSKDGELIHDFKFVETPNSLHVGNAPSPAATSALPIAEHILSQIVRKID